MIVGFTGTRMGMQTAQWRSVFDLCSSWLIKEAHHGLCKGSDDEYHWLLRTLRIGPSILIHGHPPINRGGVGQLKTFTDCNVMHPDKEYKVRDRDIVDASGRMIATPFCPEIARSGTWTTVRYARKKLKPLWIVMPDGSIIEERTMP